MEYYTLEKRDKVIYMPTKNIERRRLLDRINHKKHYKPQPKDTAYFKLRENFIKSIGGKCQVCGIAIYEVLDIHHPNPINSRKIRRTGLVGKKHILDGNAVVLCANCHRLVEKGIIPCPPILATTKQQELITVPTTTDTTP
jgi:5-methylcytosine-specific restriction endonuclease McrA